MSDVQVTLDVKTEKTLGTRLSKSQSSSEPSHRMFLNLKQFACYHVYHKSIIKNGGHLARFYDYFAECEIGV